MKIPSQKKNIKLDEGDKKLLKSICGQLQWATTQTRPDCSFETCMLSNQGDMATHQILHDANKVMRKMTEPVAIVFPSVGTPEKVKVLVYGDGSHASLPNGASQGGSLVFLYGNKRVAPIVWKSKKLQRITKSPLATEISSVADAADQGHLVASMFKEIFKLQKLPEISVLTDSQSLTDHLISTKVISDPRLRVDISRMREMTTMKEIKVKWVPSRYQLADALTKKGASADLLKSVVTSGVLPPECLGE